MLSSAKSIERRLRKVKKRLLRVRYFHRYSRFGMALGGVGDFRPGLPQLARWNDRARNRSLARGSSRAACFRISGKVGLRPRQHVPRVSGQNFGAVSERRTPSVAHHHEIIQCEGEDLNLHPISRTGT